MREDYLTKHDWNKILSSLGFKFVTADYGYNNIFDQFIVGNFKIQLYNDEMLIITKDDNMIITFYYYEINYVNEKIIDGESDWGHFMLNLGTIAKREDNYGE